MLSRVIAWTLDGWTDGFAEVSYPTDSFTILEPQSPSIDELYVVQNHRSADFMAPKLRQGSSGSYEHGHTFRVNLFSSSGI